VVLLTYFRLHLRDVPLNMQFGERYCQNYHSPSQVFLGPASSRIFRRFRKIFTYQHSERIPEFVDVLSDAGTASSGSKIWAATAYVLDRIATVLLTALTAILQEIKRVWVACVFVARRLIVAPVRDPSISR
jgi:hypothetical protein